MQSAKCRVLTAEPRPRVNGILSFSIMHFAFCTPILSLCTLRSTLGLIQFVDTEHFPAAWRDRLF